MSGRTHRCLGLVVVVLANAALAQSAVLSCVGSYAGVYTIRQGDSLSNIAAVCNIPLASLEAQNSQISDFNLIQPGMQICIPNQCSLAGSAASPSPSLNRQPTAAAPSNNIAGGQSSNGAGAGVVCSGSSLTYYSIKSGDTLASIAAVCSTSVQTILAANGQVTDANLIYAGNQLCIPRNCSLAAPTPSQGIQRLVPAAAPTPGCNQTYTVQNGDRCWQIWTTFGLTQANFTALNPAVNCSILQIGQQLCVSSSFGVPPRAPCQLSMDIQANDTCATISSAAKLTDAKLQQLNPGLPCTNLTSLRSTSHACIRNSIVTPVAPKTICTRWASMPPSTSCANFVSTSSSGVNLTLFQALNPNINCSAAQPFGGFASNVSVCVAGRVLGPTDDFSNIANPARTSLLGQIVDALAPIDPYLPPIFRNFTQQPSITNNDVLAAELRYALNQSTAVQPAAQLEQRLGRPFLEQAFFPQGITVICNFLQSHLPNSQTRQCLCSNGPQQPILTCAPQAPYDIHAAATAAISSAVPGSPSSSSSGSRSSIGSSAGSSAVGSATSPATNNAAATALPDAFAMDDAATAGRRRSLMQSDSVSYCIQVGNDSAAGNGTGSGSGVDEAALDQIAAIDQTAFTFTSLLSSFCDSTKRGSLKGAKKPPEDETKSKRLAERFYDTKTGKALKGTNDAVAKIKELTAADLKSQCCTPSACLELVPELLEVCVKGGLCTPNFEVHTIDETLLVCDAVDITNLADTAVEAAVGQQSCATADDVGADVMHEFIAQHATVGLGLCVLHEIFDSLKNIDGGFDGCWWLTVKFNYLEGTVEIIPPPISFIVLEVDVDVFIKAWDAPAGLCNSPVYHCEDFCTMQQGDVHGSIKLQQSGIITNIEDAAVSAINVIASAFGAPHVDPPPPVVIHEWPFGSAGTCASSPEAVESHSLDVFAVYTTDWAQYRNITNSTYEGEVVKRPDWCKDYGYTPKNLDASLFTHIIYAFAKIEAGTFQVTDTETDDQALQQELQSIKTSGVKTLISIGGWSFSQGSDAFAGSGSEQIFPAMASTNASRAAFIQSAIDYAQKRGFDGIDIDWE